MKILLAHNTYQQRGGEDLVFESEFKLLRDHGHDTRIMMADNDDLQNPWRKAGVALSTPFSWSGYRQCKSRLKADQTDLLHVHNFFPKFSPSIFFAAQASGVPTVLTLHNYRTVCPTTYLTLNGEVNERSLTHTPYWAVRERVYRDSYLGTLALALMIQLQKRLGTWENKVGGFITLSSFARSKFIEAGFPAEKIHVKPNFIYDPQPSSYHRKNMGEFALFVGRLAPEKGIETLLSAWEGLDIPLVIAGDGPLKELVQARTCSTIKYVGAQENKQVAALMRQARFLVMPSEWYEGFPMTLLEAYAAGLPVVASSIGSLAELVVEGTTGRLVEPAMPSELARACSELYESQEDLAFMAEFCRLTYLKKYTPEINFRQLMDIYKRVRSGEPAQSI